MKNGVKIGIAGGIGAAIAAIGTAIAIKLKKDREFSNDIELIDGDVEEVSSEDSDTTESEE